MILATRLRRVLIGTAVLLTFAVPVFAGGVNLSWDDCGLYGRTLRSFACDSNAGQDVLVCSASPPVDMPHLNGIYAVVDVRTDYYASWWQIGAGGCRSNALVPDFTFTYGSSDCLDPWNGTAIGGWTGDTSPGDNGYQLRIRVFASTNVPTFAGEGIEYFLFNLVLTHTKSTGAGSCAGCSDRACILFGYANLMQPAGEFDCSLNGPIWRDHVQWQGTTSLGCPAADEPPVATRNRTWGSVKSLYR